MRKDSNALSIVEWCKHIQAVAVGVDAPCQWSLTGRARSAERALMKEGIWCFSTPTREIAQTHPKDNFGWMLAGAELFSGLKANYRLFGGLPIDSNTLCFETFPQVVACSLASMVVSAKRKCFVRRNLLNEFGIEAKLLPNIDFVDAALCAVTAKYILAGKVKVYGDTSEGYIVVPKIE